MLDKRRRGAWSAQVILVIAALVIGFGYDLYCSVFGL